MREIKFRGQRADTKEWVYGYLIKNKLGWAFIVQDENINKFIRVIPETVGQYTGLKDKNGKEIYESDIIKGVIPEIANEPERIGIVKWGSYSWIIDFQLPKCAPGIGMVGFCSFHNYEIIGNIYENLDLLESEV